MNLALALKDALSSRYDVEIVDPHSGFVHQYYTVVSRHFLKLWDWQYTYTDNQEASLWLHRIFALFTQKRVAMLIERSKPHLIISTHSLLSYTIARASAQLPAISAPKRVQAGYRSTNDALASTFGQVERKESAPIRSTNDALASTFGQVERKENERGGKHIPLVFQLTDLEQVHMTWFTEKIADAYLAPTREVCVQALTKGIDQGRLYITGRPVRQQFLQSYATSRAETLTSLGFDPDVFTIFLQGGAKGSARIDTTIESMLAANTPTQIILAAGNNKEMASRYADLARVRVLPFTETIAPYMAASDVIAGKAGASFLSEAIILEKPFLVTAFIPGQEAPNLQFLARYNLGWICLEPTAQKELITRLATNPGILAEKVDCIRVYKTWNMQANQSISPIIERLLS